MKVAFLFPGQATNIGEAVGAWRRASPQVEQLLDCASKALGSSVEEMTRPAALSRTSIFQPVLTATTLGIHRAIVECGVVPDVVAGHSVGELAACAAAGAMADDDAVRLAATRGEWMERESTRHGGGMVALRGCEADVEAAIARGSAHGRVCVAAHNAPDEWVLSGDVDALRAIASRMPVTPLDTPGPWHSSAMAGAVEPYREALRRVITAPRHPERSEGMIPSFATLRMTTPDALVDHLAAQLRSPVQWVRAMQTLRDDNVTRVIVCGPGKSLRRFARAAIPDATVSVVAHPADLPTTS